MKKNISLSDILQLSVSERIQFVEDVWDSIALIPESVPLTDEQKLVLDQRIEAYHKDPSSGSPWSEVKSKFLSS